MLLKKILLIEDDTDDQEFFLAVVNENYAEVDCYIANDGRHGLELLNAGLDPEIIFCDLNMPFVSGREFLHKISSLYQAKELPPIVIMSTSRNEVEKKEMMALGASYYITKQHCLQVLRNEVNYALTRNWKQKKFDHNTGKDTIGRKPVARLLPMVPG